ncbi:hypothetical protein [Cellulomonas sp. NS3]|uniref:hypothetical protein n=1 Tax=Cellulomonas sp. NS3 TaxID=2973977 RepID=UPI002163EA89|nr:hypothetical protein [Cellulomonas sp. NS3]
MRAVEAPAAPTRRPGVALLVGAVTVLGLLGILAGITVAVGASTAAGGSGAAVLVVSTAQTNVPDSVSAVVNGTGLPGRAPVTIARQGPLMLSVYDDVAAPTRILARADVWAGPIAAGTAALILVPVLRSTASRDPFAPRNAPRLALAAAVTLVGWATAELLPVAAAGTVVTGLADEAGTWQPVLRPDYWPLGFVIALAVLAFATWHGRQLAADTDGLV